MNGIFRFDLGCEEFRQMLGHCHSLSQSVQNGQKILSISQTWTTATLVDVRQKTKTANQTKKDVENFLAWPRIMLVQLWIMYNLSLKLLCLHSFMFCLITTFSEKAKQSRNKFLTGSFLALLGDCISPSVISVVAYIGLSLGRAAHISWKESMTCPHVGQEEAQYGQPGRMVQTCLRSSGILQQTLDQLKVFVTVYAWCKYISHCLSIPKRKAQKHLNALIKSVIS